MTANRENWATQLTNAYQFRHACKEFDPTQIIPAELFQFILETGRLSPSSFGLEPWKFLVIQNLELREKIKALSWGAFGKLPDASHFVICLTRTEKDLDPYGAYIREEIMADTQQLAPEFIDARSERMATYLKDDLKATTPRALRDWAARQVYIPIGNMMTTAAIFGVDSCPIEGFSPDKINALLDDYDLLESDRFTTTCMVAFGYRKADPTFPKTRRTIEQVVQWVK